MQVQVRLSGALAARAGRPRLVADLPAPATAADLKRRLASEFPALAPIIDQAVTFAAGRHIAPEQPLADGQEIALVLPIAGG